MADKKRRKKSPKAQTVAQIMDEVAEEMCDKYCKYPAEWDPAYNLNYGNRSKKYMKPVLMIDSDSKEVIRKFDSLKQVETELHISHSKVSAVCYGKRKTAGGFCWRFADDSALSF